MTGRQYLGRGEIIQACAEVDIGESDVLMLHCDAIVTAQFAPAANAERYDLLIDSLEEVLGVGGTLIIPTFTYSFTEGEDFDIACSPSRVGALSEHFRKRPQVMRSANPLFSVAASGRYARRFATSESEDCFGSGSAFDLLYGLDGKIACFGCSLDRATFVHFVEQEYGVNYRYEKYWNGEVVDAQGARIAQTVRYYVRDLGRKSSTDLTLLQARLEASGILKKTEFGRLGITEVRARDFFRVATEMLEENPVALIEEGRQQS